MTTNLPNQDPQDTPPSFDFSRPLSGNIDFYKTLWQTYRQTQKLNSKKPRRLVRFAQLLWLPVDLIGLAASLFLGLPNYLLLWTFISSLVPITILEILSFLTILPVSFLTFRVKPPAIALRFFSLGYLVLLALGYTFILFFVPLILLLLCWRLFRRSGGMLKTLLLSGRALNQMAKTPATTGTAASPKPQISFKVTKSSDLPPVEPPAPPEEG